jgi:signal transduction histidine kinase
MLRRHWMAIDFLAAGFVALCALLTGIHPGPRDVSAVGLPSALVYTAVIFLAVGLRRRGPLAAFGVLAAVVALGWMSGQPALPSVALVAMAYVLYQLTVTSTRRVGIAALGGGLTEVVVIVAATHSHILANGSDLGFPGAFGLVLGWLTGYSVRQRRAYVEVLQVQAASSAVAQERLRIARELHDVVAHSMSVIAVQAGFGQYVMDTSPADTREALGAIQATSREALAELRRMLVVLRQQDGTAAAAPLAPECGLGELDRLVSRTCLAGVQVSLTCRGAVRELPAGVNVSAFRIIQESLTNVVRHAGGGAGCAVTVAYEPDVLVIEVTDDGGRDQWRPADHADDHGRPAPGHPPHGRLREAAASACHAAGSGHGLIGMRERAHLCGGILIAAPLPDGGFQVRARLPIPVRAGASAPPLAPDWSAPSQPVLELIP